MKYSVRFVFVCIFVFFLGSSGSVLAIPEVINFQGTVSSGGTPFTGTGFFKFALVSGTQGYWSSAGGSFPPMPDVEVEVVNGLYNVLLGSPDIMNPFPSDLFLMADDFHLQIQFNDGVNGMQHLTPDQPITSVGYAFMANYAWDADRVNGLRGPDLEESAEIDSDIAAHAGVSDAHHTKTTSFTELTDMATDAQIPDDISIDNSRLYAPSGVGNVGIGTMNPDAPLDVNSSGTTPSIVTRGGMDYATAAGQEMNFGHWDGSTFTSRFLIDPTGLLGIGTDSPESALHVNGEITLGTGSRDFRVREVLTTDPWGTGTISYNGIGIGSDHGTNRQMIMLTDGVEGDSIFSVTSSNDDGSNWYPRFSVFQDGNSVFQDGNVGIGTDSPQSALHVNGAITLGTGSRNFRVREVLTTDPWGTGTISYNGIGIGSDNGTNQQMIMFTDGAAGDSIFSVASSIDDGLTWNPQFSISQQGNVIIGTNSPGYDLDVNGSINALAYYGDGSNLSGISEGHWSKTGSDLYYTSGNVGIGTASPNADLEIAGGGRLFIGDGGGSNRSGLLIDGVNGGNGVATLRGLDYGTKSVMDVSINPTAGDVGIGTYTPDAKLHLREDDWEKSCNMIIEANIHNYSLSYAHPRLTFAQKERTVQPWIGIDNHHFQHPDGSDDDFNICHPNDADIVFHTNDTERMRIYGDGAGFDDGEIHFYGKAICNEFTGSFYGNFEGDGSQLYNVYGVDADWIEADGHMSSGVPGGVLIGTTTPYAKLTVDGGGAYFGIGADQVRIIGPASGGATNNTGSYPLRVDGSQQGICVGINSSAAHDGNNYLFFHDNSYLRGSIAGQNLSELHGSFAYGWFHAMSALNEAFIIAEGTACGTQGDGAEVIVMGVQGAVVYAKWAEQFYHMETSVGVVYQSNAGDYAEWLERENHSIDLLPGTIVGVQGGKVSINTQRARQLLVISTAPMILGNTPPTGREANYEKVAFMGQVPVRVRGKVNVGDYILASGFNDGIGVAVTPDEMLLEDYDRVVGVAWSDSIGSNGESLINVAVGLNTNDLLGEIKEQRSEINELKSTVNALLTYLKGKDPDLNIEMDGYAADTQEAADDTPDNYMMTQDLIVEERDVMDLTDLTDLPRFLEENPDVLDDMLSRAREIWLQRGNELTPEWDARLFTRQAFMERLEMTTPPIRQQQVRVIKDDQPAL